VSLRIALLSDLHLSVQGMALPATGADVLVLAGDLGRPESAIEWARAAPLPTLYVAGNHEFYGRDLETTYAQLREQAQGSNVRLLERGEWQHGGVRFLGCTLWSDYRLYETAAARELGLAAATRFIHDFSRIQVAPDFPDTFSPALSQLLFRQSVAWLEACFTRPHDGPTVVITHFAPSPQSIAARFRDSPVNASFVSDLTAQIERWQPALWLHGHTHDSFDYRIGRTRVVCNARGYAKEGVPENPHFDPALVLEI
jgi:Icc-related predicted phosphoesterase